MSFIEWHKKHVKSVLNIFGLSNYQGMWISFIKGLIFGALIMWFVGCKETVVIKNAPKNLELSNIESSDYSIGVKGNCGMCKFTIEQAVKDLDFVKDVEWGIQSKILDVSFKDSENYNLEILNKAITDSGYETMNTTANQSAYDNLPGCCKYDRNMEVYSPTK
tara:strand:+ start:851 stop:1339 length:489 start_codon:yes stop_codon:yes gene_type:complete